MAATRKVSWSNPAGIAKGFGKWGMHLFNKMISEDYIEQLYRICDKLETLATDNQKDIKEINSSIIRLNSRLSRLEKIVESKS